MDSLVELAGELPVALRRNRYDADTVLEVLGVGAHAALGRGEPVPARRAAASAGELGTLIRLLLLGDSLPAGRVAAALDPVAPATAVAAGLLVADGDRLRAALDLRPLDTGGGTRWVFSDLDDGPVRRRPAADHVLGVGHASLSLLRATPTESTGTVLDLGTGCGVQALHACSYADRVTGTDVNPRALRLAAATAAINGADIDLRIGTWFDPVVGERFDRIVANPPFVVGPGRVEYTYRDSGLALDGASELVVAGAPDLLAPGGVATLLASWVHTRDADWRSRVASWLPDHGIDAWVVQRDVADPALYVGTWLRDSGLDPRDPAAQRRAEHWLDTLDEAELTGIGFGFVFLRRIDGPTEVLAEDLSHGFDDPLGPEVMQYFARSAWLRDHDLRHARLRRAPDIALEQISTPTVDGWRQIGARLHRSDGPRWRHDIDDLLSALLAGLRPDGLPLGELVDLLSRGHLGGPATPEFEQAAVDAVAALIRHGLVLPGDGPAASQYLLRTSGK